MTRSFDYFYSHESAAEKLIPAEVGHVSKFRDDRAIVDDVSFTLKQGEFTLLKGESGSGKSTVIRMIAGIEEPSEGVISIEGRNIAEFDTKERRLHVARNIGLGFQSPNLLANHSVWSNIAKVNNAAEYSTSSVLNRTLGKFGLGFMSPGMYLGRKNEDHEARTFANGIGVFDKSLAIGSLRKFGLEGRIFEDAAALSGGEKLKVSLIRAIARRPKLLLLDEPTSMLDSDSAEEVYNFLYETVTEEGTTVLMISHHEKAEQYTDRTLVMESGRLVEDRQSNYLQGL
jgi:ABC-type lipoprotein export system ATPase subunit